MDPYEMEFEDVERTAKSADAPEGDVAEFMAAMADEGVLKLYSAEHLWSAYVCWCVENGRRAVSKRRLSMGWKAAGGAVTRRGWWSRPKHKDRRYEYAVSAKLMVVARATRREGWGDPVKDGGLRLAA